MTKPIHLAPIREARLQAGVSQIALAQAVGRSLNYVYKLERDLTTPTRADAERMAALLESSVDELFSRVREEIAA